MISPLTDEKLTALHNVQNNYHPNSHIAAQLKDKDIVMMVGATCEGKSTIMDEVVHLNPFFGFASTFTSRPPREGDNPDIYTYYEHSDAGLADLLGRIEKREIVQYAINPFSKFIYGTELSDYCHKYNLRDVFAGAIAGFRQLSFGSTFAITVISEPSVWLKRFEERFPVGDPQRLARKNEAMQSFTWSLAQSDRDHFFVENVDGKPEIAAQNVIEIVLGTPPNGGHARTLCEQSLKAAESIKV